MQKNGLFHVLEAQQFDFNFLREFWPLANKMRSLVASRKSDVLKNRIMLTFFDDFKPRTEGSFKAAMQNLGGSVISENRESFAYSPDDLEHLIKTLCAHGPDVIVLRLDQEGSMAKVVQFSDVPIINAGEGKLGQHPTLALGDLLTIKERFGNITGQKIVIVGTLEERAVRSLVYLLGRYRGMEIHFVFPDSSPTKEALGMEIYMRRHDVRFHRICDLRSVAELADVIYITNIQQPNGSPWDYNNHDLGYFKMDKDILRKMKKRAIIMHPLPRGEELAPEIDCDPRAVYLTCQPLNAMIARMALLVMALAPRA